MLYVLTVHHQTSRWIEPQLRWLRTFAPQPYQVWAIVDRVPRSDCAGFDVVMPYVATHGTRLNHLAAVVGEVAGADDWLLFLDSDAFPLCPLAEMLDVTTAALTAVRRDENLGDMQPHPSFALTRLGFWQDIEGDWEEGVTWRNTAGWPVSDTGANLMRKLDQRSIPWQPLLRMNTNNPHPLWFGVYGTEALGPVVYHHGAGSRDRLSRIDVHRELLAVYGKAPHRLFGAGRRRLLDDPVRLAEMADASEQWLRRIEAGERVWESLVEP